MSYEFHPEEKKIHFYKGSCTMLRDALIQNSPKLEDAEMSFSVEMDMHLWSLPKGGLAQTSRGGSGHLQWPAQHQPGPGLCPQPALWNPRA